MALLPAVHFEKDIETKNGAVCFYTLPLEKQVLIAQKSIKTLSRVDALVHVSPRGDFAKNYMTLAATAYKSVKHIETKSEEASLALRKSLVEACMTEAETERVLGTYHDVLETLFFEHHGFFLDFRTPDKYHILMESLSKTR